MVIEKDCNNTINIIDINEYDKDTVAINIITHDKVDEQLLIATTYETRAGQTFDDHIPLKEDGIYNITHVVVPNFRWLEEQKDLKGYEKVYVSNGIHVYEYQNKVLSEIDPLIFTANIQTRNTTILNREQDTIFLMNNLWKCYISKCLSILDKSSNTDNPDNKYNKYLGSHKLDKCKETDFEFFDTDFIWATINVLQYLIDSYNFEEAQKILEDIEGCNGYCNPEQNYSGVLTLNCNCNK